MEKTNNQKCINSANGLVQLVSFNCKNVKRSVDSIRQLCQSSDVIALQETWLRPDDIHYLAEIDTRFGYTGTSAMDTTVGMIRGRPYGGVALMWNKSVFPNVSIVQCDNARVSAIKINLPRESLLVFSVYMPTDKIMNLVEFTDCLSLVSATIINEDVRLAYILGDFNAHPGELFYNEMINFCSEQKWTCADIETLGLRSNTYSFISEANGSRRWLDHILTTESATKTIVNVSFNYDVIWSDHYPLCIKCNFGNIGSELLYEIKPVTNKIIWGERKPEQVDLYNKICNERLGRINYSNDFKSCGDRCCDDDTHKKLIDALYVNIIEVLSDAATSCYSLKRAFKKKPVVIGWNKYVRAAHLEAREKFKLWILYGKPKAGRVYDDMQSSRNVFKQRLKWCQNHSEQIKMDILASHHRNQDFRSFWKSTKRLNGKPSLPASINGISDHNSIASIFKSHFTVSSPLVASPSEDDEWPRGQEIIARFDAKDVHAVIQSMARGKSPGHDGLSIEHLKYAGSHLPRVLALLFNLCMSHSYLPDALMKTVVVPIVKNKNADISDKNNYRPISLATVISKVLDSLLSTQLDKYLNLHHNQFGFRPGLSTDTAILSLKQTVRYYTGRSTAVYACFLDLSKAFDLVNYDVLWQKLKNINMPTELYCLFKFWYINQVNVVRWSNAYSDPYRLECGVRQGGISSPKLFNLYVNALIEELSSTHVGCHIDDVCLNNLSYADDMVLLSASPCGLGQLLGILQQCLQDDDGAVSLLQRIGDVC
ncbi:uncharacterized protein LOC134675729 [Cydia fagiglandana]|uniref:uncharacterized protein LOC134675729 n=1 Tax=Cydia fagiglandana TaxID=1458189 RepID=UPI002FEE09C7